MPSARFFTRVPFVAAFAIAAAHASCSPSPPRPVSPTVVAPQPATANPELSTLADGQATLGFVAHALYVDGDDRPRGARFVHARTGFIFDYLAIESAPQAMFYATTYPQGDGGEPHTQEHLLLGKGNKGRFLGNTQHASFAATSAFTAQYRTVYGLRTSAGPETFWRLLRTTFDAVLHPDYGDEEIRREVRNFGVTKQPNGQLALGEKGTVYNEMVTTFESADTIAWTEAKRLLYGTSHPLAYVSGGTPEQIRTLTPDIIRRFHAAHYRLDNLTMVGAFPSSLPLSTILTRVGGVLDAFATKGPRDPAVVTEATLPAPAGAPAGTIRIVDYPFATRDHPGQAMLVWPATRHLSVGERTAMEMFLSAFAGGEGSTLYRALVDRTTRVLDLGATGVWGSVSSDQGQPAYVGLPSIASAHADEASLTALRGVVRAQLEAVAALPDGSKELTAFDDRVKARVIAVRRAEDKRLDTPPEFGGRWSGGNWLDALDDMAHMPGFRKSLVYKAALDGAEALADPAKNAWRDRIRAWGVFDVPHAIAARASPDMRARLDQERDARVATELARLEAAYGLHDAQETLRRRDAEIAQATAEIAQAEAAVPVAELAPDPPMTFDDSLKWTVETKDGVPRLAAKFDAMKSATVGVHLPLGSVPDELLPWLSVLPALMQDVGVIRGGVPITYDEVRDRLRREVLQASVHFSTSYTSGRAELAVMASGNGVDEAKLALGWGRDFLASPDWRPENLPRLRDVLDAQLTSLHETMSSREEFWVQEASDAYRHQDMALHLHTRSPLVRAHDAFVASWQLEGGPDAKGVGPFLHSLATAGKSLDRAALGKLALALASTDPKAAIDPKVASWVQAGHALPAPAQTRVRKAGKDLGQLLGDMPDASLARDWAAVCREMERGVSRPPSEGLAALKKTLAFVRHRRGARVWMVGSPEHEAALAPDIETTLASLDATAVLAVVRTPRPRILDRARAREHAAGAAKGDVTFVALVNPSTGSSSIVSSAPSAGYDETREEALVDYLAVNVFNGEGTQSFYKRIWGAGLAYSGYVYQSPESQRRILYADRCSDLPQLLHFVDGEVRNAPVRADLVDYAIVPGFWSRVGDRFESRGAGMAADLADGNTPERIRAFRARLLALRGQPGLAEKMHARYVAAMGTVIPSLTPTAPPVPGALEFVVASDSHVTDYEKELQHMLGASAKVTRLWPRDFWDVVE